MVNKPSIIFADEPSGSLDTNGKQQLHELLFDMRRKAGVTLVIVTHDESLASSADRTVRITDGIISD
jgi:lipoprotein-releasing system ATP-binding protein